MIQIGIVWFYLGYNCDGLALRVSLVAAGDVERIEFYPASDAAERWSVFLSELFTC
jgi:hypothetical protein